MLKNLQVFMCARELSVEQVAEAIRVTPMTLEAKVYEFIPFTLDEARSIRDKFFPRSQLDGAYGVFESDGDVPTERERLHHYAEAIGNALTKDGTEPDEEVDGIVKLFHDCADAAPLVEA